MIEPLSSTQATIQQRVMLQVLACWSDFPEHIRYGAARSRVSPFQDWWAEQRCRLR